MYKLYVSRAVPGEIIKQCNYLCSVTSNNTSFEIGEHVILDAGYYKVIDKNILLKTISDDKAIVKKVQVYLEEIN
ncbi:hypothetical protein [Paraclostridium dentum]|uniref:hypothetical protein n=1 Tax=Paraclostridium dentum TaxID=2662455 RepID=UPI003F2BC1CA